MKRNRRLTDITRTHAAILVVGVFVLLIMVMIVSIERRFDSQIVRRTEDIAFYRRHYAMIVEDTSDPFWKAVYQSAKTTGETLDVSIELAGEGLPSSYELADQLSLAIDADVDGIIIQSDGSEEVEKLIEQAEAGRIPVISVLEHSGGKTKTQVGASSRDIGTIYGELTVELQETKDVFSARKSIQSIVTSKDCPDVLICPDFTTAIAAYQVIVDSNKVGAVQLLVSYATEKTLDGIEKGGIFAAVSLDAQKLGANCVRRMKDLTDGKQTERFYSAPLVVITKENVKEYRENLEGGR